MRTEARNREGAAAGIPAPERQRRAQAAGPHVPFARLRSAIGGDLDSLPRELRRKPQEAARVWGRGGELGSLPPAACVFFSSPRCVSRVYDNKQADPVWTLMGPMVIIARAAVIKLSAIELSPCRPEVFVPLATVQDSRARRRGDSSPGVDLAGSSSRSATVPVPEVERSREIDGWCTYTFLL